MPSQQCSSRSTASSSGSIPLRLPRERPVLPNRRGATLAVHSMLGYAGGFVGPLLVGLILDLSGGMSPTGWGMSFLAVAVLMAIALVTFWLIRPRELEGDNSKRR